MSTATKDQIDAILREQMGVLRLPDQLVWPGALLVDDLRFDLLDVAVIVCAIEDEWDVEVSDDDLAMWMTVGDIYRSAGVDAVGAPVLVEGE